MNQTLRSYITTLVSTSFGKVALASGLTVCLSLTEGVGLLMLVPLLQLVGLNVHSGALGSVAQFVSSVFATVGLRPTLVTVLLIYVLITSLHALLHRCQTTANLSLNYEIVVHLRQRVYRALAYANWLLFSRSRSSDFVHVLTDEVDRVGAATYQLLHLFVTGLVAAVYVVFALKISASMTALVSVCGGSLVLMLRGKMQVARTTGEGLSQAMSSLYAAITDHVGGMKTAKSHGVEERHITVFTRITEEVRQMYVRAVRNQAEVKYWFNIGSVLVLSVIVYISLKFLAISTAELLLLLFLFARLIPKFSSVQQGYQSLINLLPAFERVVEMQARCEAASESRPNRSEKIELRRAIRLEHVSFAYDKRPVITDLNMTIRTGKTTAIVGPSGAGKSTVADLIIGLIAPSRGRVLIDGTPLSPERMDSWREHIGYVAQDTFLFHDTVRANLLWARPDASEDHIRQALRLAAAEDFVSKLAKELDTVVGDHGVRLSGGERQRLALARALLRTPSVLILDEATSSLDSENERRIQRAIEGLHGCMTIVIISHRLSSVRHADIVYVLDDGQIVESAAWDILVTRKNGRLYNLAQIQGIEVSA